MRTTTRTAGFVAVIAIVTAVLSPAVSAQAAPVPQLTGTVTSGPAWVDATLDAEMTVGVAYSSSVTGPTGGGWAPLTTSGLPAGLTASFDQATGLITLSGTPTAPVSSGGFSFSYAQDSEVTYTIEFEGVEVVSATDPTSTSVTALSYQHYRSVQFDAVVTPLGSEIPTGTVVFKIGTTTVATQPVSTQGTAGVASFSGAIASSFVGTTGVVTAVYSGDENYSPSTSGSTFVYFYGDRVVSGSFVRNGVGVAGEHIQLVAENNTPTSFTDVTDSSGNFEITLTAPTSFAAAQARYMVKAADSGFFYLDGIGAGTESPTSFFDATATADAAWRESLVIRENVDPTWVDQALAQPRVGEAYSDSVSANPNGVGLMIYTTSGDVPSWLTVGLTTGVVSSTGATDQNPHTFTVRAASSWGYIEKQFTLQAGDAAVPPTFTDTDIADLQVGTPLTDAIAATGDATITYSSTALPPGLVLNAATGALTGTPTAAGDYVVTFTASNGTDPDATFVWEPTIAAAPDLELTLNFAAGTTIDDADTEIGADGLKVGSTYTLYLHSTPVLLYTGTVGPTGAFLHTVTLPADTPAGAHELILTGIAPDGTVMTAHAWFTLLSNGRIGAISYSGPLSFTLALTGSEPLVPVGIASALLLGGFLALRRARAQVAAR